MDYFVFWEKSLFSLSQFIQSFTPYDHDPDTAVIHWAAGAADIVPDGARAAGAADAAMVHAAAVVAAASSMQPLVVGPPNGTHNDDDDAGPDDDVAEEQQQEERAAAGSGGGGASEFLAHLDMLTNLSLTDSSDQCIPQLVDSLRGIKIVGSSAGHRHSLFLDEQGGLYSCGAGVSGCLGHGNNQSQMYPMKLQAFGKQFAIGCILYLLSCV
jgi:hypothetical protein